MKTPVPKLPAPQIERRIECTRSLVQRPFAQEMKQWFYIIILFPKRNRLKGSDLRPRTTKFVQSRKSIWLQYPRSLLLIEIKDRNTMCGN